MLQGIIQSLTRRIQEQVSSMIYYYAIRWLPPQNLVFSTARGKIWVDHYSLLAYLLSHSSSTLCCATEKLSSVEVSYPLEIMDYVCRVTPSKLGHRDIDLFIVLFDVNLHILVQLQLPLEWRIKGVFVEDTTVEHALPGKLGKLHQNRDTHTCTHHYLPDSGPH